MKPLTIFICLLVQIITAQNTTHDVFFETDKYHISEAEKQKLIRFISTIDTSQITSISIFGYCDDRGSVHYNQILSEKRAYTIKTIFISNGFNNHQIKIASGKGEVALSPSDTEKVNTVRSQNRRVNISFASGHGISENSPKERTITSTEIKKETVKSEPKSENKVVVIKGYPDNNIDVLNDDFKVGDKIRFENLYFEVGYSFLLPESKKELEKIAEILVKRNNIFFTIEGHVCCTSDTRDAVDFKTKEINLSVARAKYTYDFLAEKGIEKYRMKYVGMQRKFPLGGDAKYDRRVEFLITYVGGEKQ